VLEATAGIRVCGMLNALGPRRVSTDVGGFTPMPASQPNEERRDCSLPPGYKELVLLPEEVSVRYLMDTTGACEQTMTLLMRKLGILGEVSRAIDFKDAARILARYGILAKRDTTA
jgi:hypothetical protein